MGVMESRRKWRGCTYSHEDYDYISNLADKLTEEDRANGDPSAPRYGSSQKNIERAQAALKSDIEEMRAENAKYYRK
jgi:hypothetical protein